jgi:hypothetical protein
MKKHSTPRSAHFTPRRGRRQPNHAPGRGKKYPWLPKGVSMLEYELTEILSRHCGERNICNEGEGAVETLCRIIQERDRAMTLLAMDRLIRG